MTITSSSIVGLAPGPIVYEATGGTFNGGVAISGGCGGSQFDVERIRSTTHLFLGDGDDAVTVADIDSSALTVSGQDGDDQIDASATTRSITLIGGPGADTISGGAGDDRIVGGSVVSGALDGGDVLDAGLGNDVIAGDNASTPPARPPDPHPF